MATEISEYLADLILTALAHDGSIAVPTELTIKMFETMPARDGTGGAETAYTSYVAQTVACGASSKWEAPALDTDHVATSNHEAINFPENTGSAVSIAGFGIYDGANLLFLDEEAFEVPNGLAKTVDANNLVIGWATDSPFGYGFQTAIFNALFANTAYAARSSLVLAQCTTLPNKADSGAVKANFTGYADVTLACGASSDFDAIGDEDSLRMIANTNEEDFGVKNTGTSQTVTGYTIRDNAAALVAIATYAVAKPVEPGTKVTLKADSLHIRF